MRFLKQNLIVITLFLVVFGLYLSTAPHVPVNYADSNELITASYTLGIPHPPGYPLFVLIGKLFSYIPISTIAFRYAIMSSLFGALTVTLVYLTLERVFRKDEVGNWALEIRNFKLGISVPALVGALSLAFSYLFWLYSIVPEVFALSNFFAAMIIYLGISWYFDAKNVNSRLSTVNSDRPLTISHKLRRFIGEKDYYPVLIAITSSLGFLAHQTIVFFAPALIYLIWISDKSLFKSLKRWLKVMAGLIIGLLPSLYFPIISYVKTPVIDFGNVTSLKMFWRLMSRYYYSPDNPVGAYGDPTRLKNDWLAGLKMYFETINNSFTALLFFTGILAVIFLVYISIKNRNYKNIKNFILISFLFSGLLLGAYAVVRASGFSYETLGVHERMYILSTVPFALLVGIGINFILIYTGRLKVGIVSLAVALSFITASLTPAFLNHSLVDKSDFYLAQDYAHNLFVNIEPGSIFFITGSAFATYYDQYIEQKRQDVIVVPYAYPLEWNRERFREKYKGIIFDTDSDSDTILLRNIIEYNIDKRPIYITALPDSHKARMGLNGTPYTLSPRGLVQKVTKEFSLGEGTAYWDNLTWRHSKKVADHYDWLAKGMLHDYSLAHHKNFIQYMRHGYYNLAQYELEQMQTIDPDHPTTIETAEAFEKADKKEGPKNIYKPTAEQLEAQTVQFINSGQLLAAYGNLLYLIEQHPDNPAYHYNLAQLYMSFDWPQKAKKEYEIVVELNPQDTKAREKLNEIKALELR